MECFRCGSLKIVRFIDGFGDRRVFCKKCWGSFPLDGEFKQFEGQKNLREFNLDMYYRSRFQR